MGMGLLMNLSKTLFTRQRGDHKKRGKSEMRHSRIMISQGNHEFKRPLPVCLGHLPSHVRHSKFGDGGREDLMTLQQQSIIMVVPHPSNCIASETQLGHSLRSHKAVCLSLSLFFIYFLYLYPTLLQPMWLLQGGLQTFKSNLHFNIKYDNTKLN